MTRKFTYDLLHKVFIQKDCKLQLTEHDYNQIKGLKNTRLYFIAKCGHNNSASFTNFLYKNTGVICIQCSIKNCKEKMTNFNNSNVSLQQYQEVIFAERRISQLNFLDFEKPPLDGTVYDFTLNGSKHQEKVATYVMKKDHYIVNLSKSNGNRLQYYHISDNDFYWFWIKDKSFFTSFQHPFY